ncbi:MAG TPA: DNA methyltransferase [Polyangiaceae bacterium]
MTDPRGRRSLTHVGGKVERFGNPETSQKVAHALDVKSSLSEEEPSRVHVHGFHAYPARMHPTTAARLVHAFSPENGSILDPFCGSGTVLVEGLLLGRNTFGSDINPLAVEIAMTKTTSLTKEDGDALITTAWEIAAFADERRKAKAGASRRFPKEDTEQFSPHVLLELDSLRMKIERIKSAKIRMPLFLCLSAILVKVSQKESDTSDRQGPRRIAAGYTAKLFGKKVEELVERREIFTEALPDPRPKSIVQIDDAAKLGKIKPKSVDAVITSPPYAATYDYILHHDMRLRWLNLQATAFEKQELGSRRSYAPLSGQVALEKAIEETRQYLAAMARALKPGGHVALVVGDSAVKRFALRADFIVREAAKKTPLSYVAHATQTRPHFHAATAAAFEDAPRAEHAIVLRA